MLEPWEVLLDVGVLRRVGGLPKEDRYNLAAIQQLLQAQGPDAFDFDIEGGVAPEALERIEAALMVTIWVPAGGPFYELRLEVLPGRTIVIRSMRRRG